jgi:hypothetical protein
MCRGRISRTSEEGEKRIAGRSLYNGSMTPVIIEPVLVQRLPALVHAR